MPVSPSLSSMQDLPSDAPASAPALTARLPSNICSCAFSPLAQEQEAAVETSKSPSKSASPAKPKTPVKVLSSDALPQLLP
jgi:hypothetical protein